ncbi:hypothetical protein [Nostoc sp. S13]|uniref:hypothetical protein n=1 Tax=Nostoc sp. S13 TaxID=3019266 RepID=UPI0026202D48|nr:hypothetical protein [Nostoc sp. S13]MDF5736130.1 hypothetical protein [Nostoc sp. S13]
MPNTSLREATPTASLRDATRTLSTSAQCPMPNAQCPMPNAQCPIPNTQYPIPNFSDRQLIEHGSIYIGLIEIPEFSENFLLD